MPEQTNIKVVVRVRPYNRRELEQNQRCIIKVMDESTLLFDPEEEDDEFFFQGAKQNYRDVTKRVHKKLSMEFDRVFDTDIPNTQIFDECTSPLVDSVLNGYNCSVFVYGATGAGKTFTMLGSENMPGLTFLTMRDLFEKIQSQSTMRKFDVGVSYLEVYNEQVMNLLTKTGPLKLREDSNGVVVSGLVLKPIYTAEELLELLKLGNSNRTQHPTDANAESSRSHAVFQVHIRITEIKTGTKRTVKLSMIDLAGSERAASTKGIGLRFKEGASINKSLLALGNCINKLADGLKHIPYRDSNLTRILKDSLGGNCQTLMVANVSMSSLTYEDTYNTLKYASRAKKIRTTLRQNTLKSNMPKDFYIRKVTELMAENERLKESKKTLETLTEELKKKPRGPDESELRRWYSKIDAVYSSVIKTQEYVVGIKSKVMTLKLKLEVLNDEENKRKLLILDDASYKEDMAILESNTAAIQKQINQQKDELPRWIKKLQSARSDLEKLKQEVKESNCYDILKNYMSGKELEVCNAYANSKLNHQSAISTVLISNSCRLVKDFFMSCDLLQQSYDKLSADGQLSPNIKKNYEKLEQRLRPKGQRNIHTADEDAYYNGTTHTSATTTSTTILLNGNSTEGGMKTTNSTTKTALSLPTASASKKRKRSLQMYFDDIAIGLNAIGETDTDEFDGSESDDGKLSKKACYLDITQTLPPSTQLPMDDANKTFEFGQQNHLQPHHNNNNYKSSLSKSGKKLFVSNVLSEQIARLPTNTDKLKNVLLKSKNFTPQGLLKTVAAGVQKENKRFSPNRVRKSPRKLPTLTTANNNGMNSTHVVKKPLRPGTSRPEPTVRINRAASFRARK